MLHLNTAIRLTVKGNRLETPGYRSIVFERPQNFEYESGDWIDIEAEGKVLRGGKTYSLSSSPTEPDLMITFKDGVSELKRELATTKPGDTFIVTQYGNDYKFTLKPNKPSTLIAGGVGVAPFRSMLIEMVAHRDKNLVDLVYLNQTDQFLFKEEFDACLRQLPGLTLSLHVTKDMKKKDKTKLLMSYAKSPNNSFYIAGPEGMVESTEHLLLDAGVRLSNIKIDSFGGY